MPLNTNNDSCAASSSSSSCEQVCSIDNDNPEPSRTIPTPFFIPNPDSAPKLPLQVKLYLPVIRGILTNNTSSSQMIDRLVDSIKSSAIDAQKSQPAMVFHLLVIDPEIRSRLATILCFCLSDNQNENLSFLQDLLLEKFAFGNLGKESDVANALEVDEEQLEENRARFVADIMGKLVKKSSDCAININAEAQTLFSNRIHPSWDRLCHTLSQKRAAPTNAVFFEQLSKYLAASHEESIQKLLCSLEIVKSKNLAQVSNTLIKHLILSSTGKKLVQDILLEYGRMNNSNATLLFFTEVLTFDASLEEAAQEYKELFSNTFILSEGFKSFAEKCLNIAIFVEKLGYTPPTLQYRYSWQREFQQILHLPSNKCYYDTRERQILWAYFFTSTPLQFAFTISKFTPFRTIFRNALSSKLGQDERYLELLLECSFVEKLDTTELFTPDFPHREPPPKLDNALQNCCINLCKSLLASKVTTSAARGYDMLFGRGMINAQKLSEMSFKRSEAFMMVVEDISNGKNNPHGVRIARMFFEIIKRYPESDRFTLFSEILYYGALCHIQNSPRHPDHNSFLIEMVNCIDESELANVLSVMWEKEYLDSSFSLAVFPSQEHSDENVPYSKFINAIGSLNNSLEVLQKVVPQRPVHPECALQ